MSRFLIISTVFTVLGTTLLGVAQDSKDTPKAAVTRKKLKQKVTVDYADEPIRQVAEDLMDKIRGIGILIDSKGGVSGNIKINYKAEDKPLEEVFDGMFKKNGLGYVVISKAGNAYDGNVLIKQGPERGYEKGQEPDVSSSQDKDKANTQKPGAKDKGKDKSAAKDKSTDKNKPTASDKPALEGDKAEQDAARKLKFAKTFVDDGKKAIAKERLQEIVSKYSKTKAADEARELLKKLDN